MTLAMKFQPGFLERTQRMAGLKTTRAFAGAIGVSEGLLSKALKTGVATPALIIGLYTAFGFQPGEITTIGEVPDKDAREEQSTVASPQLEVTA